MINNWKPQNRIKWQVFIEDDRVPYEYEDFFPDVAARLAIEEYDQSNLWLATRNQSITVRVKHPYQEWEAFYEVEGSMQPHYFAYQKEIVISDE